MKTVASLRFEPSSVAGVSGSLPEASNAPWEMLRIRGRSFSANAYQLQASTSYEQCERTCKNEQDCVGLTYQAKRQTCKLFNTIGELSGDQDSDAGIKHQSACADTVSSSRMPAPLSVTEECSLKPKETFKECDTCPEMVVAPAGSFTMGSQASEPDRNSDEGPQHSVAIARQFAVGQFEVTFDEWDACAADGGCDGYRPSDAGWGRGRRPVINVSWSDAKSRKRGVARRLI